MPDQCVIPDMCTPSVVYFPVPPISDYDMVQAFFAGYVLSTAVKS